MLYVFKSSEGVTAFQSTQFTIITDSRPFFLNHVRQMKKGKKERERSILLICVGSKTINTRITLIAGHWTLYGSVMIRFENFPIAYDNKNFEADFSLMLLEPIKRKPKTTIGMVYLNRITIPIQNIKAFEPWLKEQVTNAWNV